MRAGTSPLACLALWEGACAIATSPVSPSHPPSGVPRRKGKSPPFSVWVGTVRKDDFTEARKTRGR